MQRSNPQILKETATRLNKAWTKNLHKDPENEHFCSQITKRKLENDRHTLHQVVDSVLTKRSRLEYRVEEEILDSALSSENHDTQDEVEQEEQEAQREQNEQEDQRDQDGQDDQEDDDDETDQEQLNKLELEELRANLAEVTHNELAPVRLPMPDIDDSAIMTAVRHCINGDADDASEALRPLHRKLCIMLESLMDKLPQKADKMLAEGTFVADYVSPIIHGFMGIDKHVTIHFPNTESKLQKYQGIKPDRPDIIVKVRGHEVFFGEVTGPTKASDMSKCAWDAFRLARFAKSYLEDGNDVAPILQVIYTSGSYIWLHVKACGMFLLEEVSNFEIHTTISKIPSLVATLSTLLVAQVLQGFVSKAFV
ncbi:hypothetical protein BGZ98_002215 [Dissophora globulifera]|nr:hypothetical protein BGZ98_002215 [Dissophora globulifera]